MRPRSAVEDSATTSDALAALAAATRGLAPSDPVAAQAALHWLALPGQEWPALLAPFRAYCPDPVVLRRLLHLCAGKGGEGAAAVTDLLPYLAEGWREGRSPIPGFDPLGYEVLSARRRDPQDAGLLHYAREGLARGLDPAPAVAAEPRSAPDPGVTLLADLAGAATDPVDWIGAVLRAQAAPPADGAELLVLDRSLGGRAASRLADAFPAALRTGHLRLLLVESPTLAEALPSVLAEMTGQRLALLPPPMPTAKTGSDMLPQPALARHDRRACLRNGLIGPRILLRCPAPDAARAHLWGDYHFAKSLAEALGAAGCQVQIALADDWDAPTSADLPPPDATLLLRGVRRCRPRPGPVNLMWMISHPDRVTLEEMQRYDHVFVASLPHAARLRPALGSRVSALLQCSDPARFARETPVPGAIPAHPLLFVGNSRGAERWIVSAALAGGHRLAVYGAQWQDTPVEAAVMAENIANDRLAAYYRRAGIVLNDHWPDMAAQGFVSNRLFDLAMAEAFPISDSFEGAGMFFGNLVQVRDGEELDRAIRHFAARPDERARRAAALHRLVRHRHTFAARATRILDQLRRLF